MSPPTRLLASETRSDGHVFLLYAPDFRSVEDYILKTAAISNRAEVCTRAGVPMDSDNHKDTFIRMRQWVFICAAVRASKEPQ